MIAVGFLNESNAPTEDVTKHFPSDLEPLTPEQVEKNIMSRNCQYIEDMRVNEIHNVCNEIHNR